MCCWHANYLWSKFASPWDTGILYHMCVSCIKDWSLTFVTGHFPLTLFRVLGSLGSGEAEAVYRRFATELVVAQECMLTRMWKGSNVTKCLVLMVPLVHALWFVNVECSDMGLVARKPVLRVSDKVRFSNQPAQLQRPARKMNFRS